MTLIIFDAHLGVPRYLDPQSDNQMTGLTLTSLERKLGIWPIPCIYLLSCYFRGSVVGTNQAVRLCRCTWPRFGDLLVTVQKEHSFTIIAASIRGQLARIYDLEALSFRLLGTWLLVRQICLFDLKIRRQILMHTSGFPEYPPRTLV